MVRMLFFIKIIVLLSFFTEKSYAKTPWEGWDEPRNFIAAALGDSITLATNSNGLGVNKEYSWASGDANDFLSHRARLQNALMDRKVIFHNFAVNGATVADVAVKQVEQALTLPHLDYLTVLIGANDACHWNPSQYADKLEIYKSNLHLILSKITDKFKDVTIVLLPVPNMLLLKARFAPLFSCQKIWNFLEFCPSLLPSYVSDRQTELFGSMLKKLNSSIGQISSEYANVHHDESLYTAEFDQKHVSRSDCFHPSIGGQSLISEIAFETLIK